MNLHGSHGRTNGAVGLQGHTAFGAGFTWGASYMIWGYDGAAEAAKEPAQFYKEGLMTREEWNALRHHDDNV